MTSPRPTTFDKAASQIAGYVRPLEQGAPAMAFSVKDETGRTLSMSDDAISGGHMALLFLSNPASAEAAALLYAFANVPDTLRVIAFSASSDAAANRKLATAQGFNGSIPGDATGAIFASYGLMKHANPPARAVLLTPNRIIRGWIDLPAPETNILETFMSIVETETGAAASPWVAPHAPVLTIPNMLSREECAGLINLFEEDTPFMVRPPRQGELVGQNYVMPVYEHNRQDRVDMILRDQNALTLIDTRIHERVAPMIKKAFAFDVTRREDLHIARYEGERGGNQMGHRDNVSAATAYRRFALSVNLNDDFEGGGLAFREFGETPYRGAPGTALIFSSSLLHEVQETTKGVRYNLISHFFNEASTQGR